MLYGEMILSSDTMSDERSNRVVRQDFDVVIVGAGPAGLAAGITLGLHDVDALLVDRRPSTSTLPRATVASTGTMELVRRWGIEEETWQRSIDVEWRAWSCTSLAAADDGVAVDVGLPSRDQALVVSPTSPACIPQDDLEPLLERRVKSLGTVRLARRVEVVGLERAHVDGYVLTLTGPDGGRHRVRARYVIGADGIDSHVRRLLGITYDGESGLAWRLVAVFRAPIWDLLGRHRYGIYFLGGERSFIPAGKPDRWIFGMAWEPGTPLPGAGQVKALIREAAGLPDLRVEVERMMPVEFGIGMAERFREGNAFLIGDAAHRVTPRGGTGMNAAIRDGFDLGWKLAWVLRGWAGHELLKSFERERRPVVELNTERSSRSDGSILPTAAGLTLDIGGRIPHVWVPRGDGLVSTLDLLGDGLTLFAAPDWNGEPASGRRVSAPVTLQRLDTISALGLGLSNAGALLVRPDGRSLALANYELAVASATPPLELVAGGAGQAGV
jgi:putative polyketide hydroxylase